MMSKKSVVLGVLLCLYGSGTVFAEDLMQTVDYSKVFDDDVNSVTVVNNGSQAWKNTAVKVEYDKKNDITVNGSLLNITSNTYSMASTVYARNGELNFYGDAAKIVIENNLANNYYEKEQYDGTAIMLHDAAKSSNAAKINFYNKETEIKGASAYGIKIEGYYQHEDGVSTLYSHGDLKIDLDRSQLKQQNGNKLYAIFLKGGKMQADADVAINLQGSAQDRYIAGFFLDNGESKNKLASAVGIDGKLKLNIFAQKSDDAKKKTSAYGMYVLDRNGINNGTKVNIKNGADIFITGSDNAYGMYDSGGEITLDSGAVVNVADSGTAYGMSIQNGGKVTAGDVVNIGITKGSSGYGVYANGSESSLTLDKGIGVNITDTDKAYAMFIQNGGKVTAGEIAAINIENAASAYGMYISGADSSIALKQGAVISIQDGTKAYGMLIQNGGKVTADDGVVIAMSGSDSNYGILTSSADSAFSGTDVKVDIAAEGGMALVAQKGGKIAVTGSVGINADYALWSIGSEIDVAEGLITGEEKKNIILAQDGGTININNSGDGMVQYTGKAYSTDADSVINMQLNDANSYWNVTADSNLNNLILDCGAKINLGYYKDEFNGFHNLHVNSLTGSEGSVNMNIDASRNVANSDRLYIDGTHEGTHYITLDNVGTGGVDGAEGTVLVSVKDEQGEFKANDSEGKLFWNKYTLDKLEGESVTDGYAADWYLKYVEQADDPTTSVDTIVGANALNYHTWRSESDKLLKRMGDLRHNGADEQGLWFRMRGNKISRSDSAAFANKYTAYELGYDTLIKETASYKQYAGAAFSYTDGNGSYNSGFGENDSKSLSIYTTKIGNKGHYLDFVFKVTDMNNDFTVFDTQQNVICGKNDNQGVSVNVEYGRKKDIGCNWYVEPQGQLTLGYLGGDVYQTSNGIMVDQGGIPSLTGRIGVNVGKDFDSATNIYLKANVLHEFLGDYTLRLIDTANGDSLEKSGSFKDTWYEIGVGAAIKTGKNNHLYFDVEKSFGGDFKKDWAWNAGIRWTF